MATGKKIQNLDFSKQTFEVGNLYTKKDIDKMAEINKGVVAVDIYGVANPRKSAIHLNFTREGIDLWFIRQDWSYYKCVIFEN